MLVLIEASAKPNAFDPIQGWTPSSSAELGLQARIRRSAKLSTIMPSFVRGGGPRRQVHCASALSG